MDAILAKSTSNLREFQAAQRSRFAEPELGVGGSNFLLPSLSLALSTLNSYTPNAYESQARVTSKATTHSISDAILPDRKRETLEAYLLARNDPIPTRERPTPGDENALGGPSAGYATSLHSLAGMEKAVDLHSGLVGSSRVSLATGEREEGGLLHHLREAYAASAVARPRPVSRALSRERPPLSAPTSTTPYQGEWAADGSAASAAAAVSLGTLDTWLPSEALLKVLAFTVENTAEGVKGARQALLKDLPFAVEGWLEKRDSAKPFVNSWGKERAITPVPPPTPSSLSSSSSSSSSSVPSTPGKGRGSVSSGVGTPSSTPSIFTTKNGVLAAAAAAILPPKHYTPLLFGEVVDAYLVLCLEQGPILPLGGLDDEDGGGGTPLLVMPPSLALPQNSSNNPPAPPPHSSPPRQNIEYADGRGIGRRGASVGRQLGQPVIAGVSAIDADTHAFLGVLSHGGVPKGVGGKRGSAIPGFAGHDHHYHHHHHQYSSKGGAGGPPTLNPLLAGRPTRVSLLPAHIAAAAAASTAAAIQTAAATATATAAAAATAAGEATAAAASSSAVAPPLPPRHPLLPPPQVIIPPTPTLSSFFAAPPSRPTPTVTAPPSSAASTTPRGGMVADAAAATVVATPPPFALAHIDALPLLETLAGLHPRTISSLHPQQTLRLWHCFLFASEGGGGGEEEGSGTSSISGSSSRAGGEFASQPSLSSATKPLPQHPILKGSKPSQVGPFTPQSLSKLLGCTRVTLEGLLGICWRLGYNPKGVPSVGRYARELFKGRAKPMNLGWSSFSSTTLGISFADMCDFVAGVMVFGSGVWKEGVEVAQRAESVGRAQIALAQSTQAVDAAAVALRNSLGLAAAVAAPTFSAAAAAPTPSSSSFSAMMEAGATLAVSGALRDVSTTTLGGRGGSGSGSVSGSSHPLYSPVPCVLSGGGGIVYIPPFPSNPTSASSITSGGGVFRDGKTCTVAIHMVDGWCGYPGSDPWSAPLGEFGGGVVLGGGGQRFVGDAPLNYEQYATTVLLARPLAEVYEILPPPPPPAPTAPAPAPAPAIPLAHPASNPTLITAIPPVLPPPAPPVGSADSTAMTGDGAAAPVNAESAPLPPLPVPSPSLAEPLPAGAAEGGAGTTPGTAPALPLPLQHPFPFDTKVYARFKGGKKAYKGVISGVKIQRGAPANAAPSTTTTPATPTTYLYTVTYDNGEEENDVPMKHVKSAADIKAATAAAAAATAAAVQTAATVEGEGKTPLAATSAPITAAAAAAAVEAVAPPSSKAEEGAGAEVCPTPSNPPVASAGGSGGEAVVPAGVVDVKGGVAAGSEPPLEGAAVAGAPAEVAQREEKAPPPLSQEGKEEEEVGEKKKEVMQASEIPPSGPKVSTLGESDGTSSTRSSTPPVASTISSVEATPTAPSAPFTSATISHEPAISVTTVPAVPLQPLPAEAKAVAVVAVAVEEEEEEEETPREVQLPPQEPPSAPPASEPPLAPLVPPTPAAPVLPSPDSLPPPTVVEAAVEVVVDTPLPTSSTPPPLVAVATAGAVVAAVAAAMEVVEVIEVEEEDIKQGGVEEMNATSASSSSFTTSTTSLSLAGEGGDATPIPLPYPPPPPPPSLNTTLDTSSAGEGGGGGGGIPSDITLQDTMPSQISPPGIASDTTSASAATATTTAEGGGSGASSIPRPATTTTTPITTISSAPERKASATFDMGDSAAVGAAAATPSTISSKGGLLLPTPKPTLVAPSPTLRHSVTFSSTLEAPSTSTLPQHRVASPSTGVLKKPSPSPYSDKIKTIRK